MPEAFLFNMVKRVGIGGALIIVGGHEAGNGVDAPIRLSGIGPSPMIVHLCTAVRAEHQPGQRIGDACFVDPVNGFPRLLGKLPRVLVDNGFMGIFDDRPIFRCLHDRHFILVRFLPITEVDTVAHVFWPGDDLDHRCGRPVIGPVHVREILADADTLPGKVYGRAFYMLVP